MDTKDWLYLIATIAIPFLAAGLTAFLTLYWQDRKEKREVKRRFFFTLMMHRKTDPPHLEWVNAVNMIEVVFADHPDVLAKWNTLWEILNDKSKVGTQAHQHAQLNMLSTMAQAVGYKNLKQTDIDRFYSPQVYATQAAAQQEMQSLGKAFLESVNNFISSQIRANQPAADPKTRITITPPGETSRK